VCRCGEWMLESRSLGGTRCYRCGAILVEVVGCL
jgi:hypothetical protein